MAEIQEMIDSTREKVRGFLQELGHDFQEYEGGMFTLQEGSAVVGVTIRPWYENDVAVEFTSQLVNDARLDAETMRWLLEKNSEIHFGGFGVLFDGTIAYSQTLPGCGLNKESFHATAMTVSTIADHYDDEIVKIAGGVLASQDGAEMSREMEEASS